MNSQQRFQAIIGVLVIGIISIAAVLIPYLSQIKQNQGESVTPTAPEDSQAWSTSQSATSKCSTNGANIEVSFTNTEGSGDQFCMKVTATDLQSNKTVDLGQIKPGETKTGTISTDKTTIENGSVRFDLLWCDGHNNNAADTRLANYGALTCTASKPQLSAALSCDFGIKITTTESVPTVDQKNGTCNITNPNNETKDISVAWQGIQDRTATWEAAKSSFFTSNGVYRINSCSFSAGNVKNLPLEQTLSCTQSTPTPTNSKAPTPTNTKTPTPTTNSNLRISTFSCAEIHTVSPAGPTGLENTTGTCKVKRPDNTTTSVTLYWDKYSGTNFTAHWRTTQTDYYTVAGQYTLTECSFANNLPVENLPYSTNLSCGTTPTATLTKAPTATVTKSPSVTPTITKAPTITTTKAPTPTSTRIPTPTATPTPNICVLEIHPKARNTLTPIPTSTNTPVPTETTTPTPTNTPNPSETPTNTPNPSQTPTSTLTQAPTNTPNPASTATPTNKPTTYVAANTPTPVEKLPAAGVAAPTLMVSIAGIVFIIIAGLLII